MVELSHINARGEANMVDVADKAVTERVARAGGQIVMRAETFARIDEGSTAKGDVLAAARIAGIMAVKKTSELIPLCHPLAIAKAAIEFDALPNGSGLKVFCTVRVTGQTGVEMEALTGVSVACLTIYDMLKAVDKDMVVSDIRLLEKSGGRSGTYRASEDDAQDVGGS